MACSGLEPAHVGVLSDICTPVKSSNKTFALAAKQIEQSVASPNAIWEIHISFGRQGSCGEHVRRSSSVTGELYMISLCRLRDVEKAGKQFAPPRHAKRTDGRLEQAERREKELARLEAIRGQRPRFGGAASQRDRPDNDAGAVICRTAEVSAGVSHSSPGANGGSREGSSSGERGGGAPTASHGDAGSIDSQPITKRVIVVTDSDTAPLLAPAPASGHDTGV